MDDMPTKTGVYWARKYYSTTWDYIVKIQGEEPFFTYIAWSLQYPGRGSIEYVELAGTNPLHFIFAEEIKQDYVLNQTIPTPRQCGLYWASTTKLTDSGQSLWAQADRHFEDIKGKEIILVYITGTIPYMSCFTWNTKTDIKDRVLKVSSLIFFKHIDEPLELTLK